MRPIETILDEMSEQTDAFIFFESLPFSEKEERREKIYQQQIDDGIDDTEFDFHDANWRLFKAEKESAKAINLMMANV
jgi:hypothetical protein